MNKDQKILGAMVLAVAGILLLPLLVKATEEEKRPVKIVGAPIFSAV